MVNAVVRLHQHIEFLSRDGRGLFSARMQDDIACADGVVKGIVVAEEEGDFIGLPLLLGIFRARRA